MGKVSAKDRRKEKAEVVEAATGDMKFSDDVMKFFRKELDIDIIEEYRALKDVAKIPADKLLDRVALTKAINGAAKNSRAANKVFLKARSAREYFRIDFDRKIRDLNWKAMEIIGTKMDEGEIKKKQITQDLIRQELSAHKLLRYEYQALIEKQEELRSIKSDCEVLAKEWADRKWTLRAQVQLVTAEREMTMPSESKR